MFVGQSGVARVIARTCEAMNAAGIDDAHDLERVRALGVIDLPTIQRKANLHFSVSLDLFGSEVSTNAANYFNAGLKGRYRETRIEDDHRLLDATYPVLTLEEGAIRSVGEPALTAINMRLRDDYVKECARGVERWNKVIAAAGVEFRLELPHVAFNRKIGQFAGVEATPAGELVDAEAWAASCERFLPSAADGEYIASLMRPVTEPGAYAPWIAPPQSGIDNKPGDFEYVRISH